MTMPLQLKMPHPDKWLRPLLDVDHCPDCCGRYASDTAQLAQEVAAAATPHIAAATLEAAAELVESYDGPPPASGGQWLQMLAEQCRGGMAHVGDGPPVTITPASPRALLEVERERDNLAREVRRLEGLLRERKRAPWWRRIGGAR